MRRGLLIAALVCCLPGVAQAAKGDVTGTLSVGTSAFSYNLSASKFTSLANTVPFSEFVGAGYFVTDHWRVALNLQFTESLTAVPEGVSRFTTFAFLPQASYSFAKHFFVAAVLFIPIQYASVVQGGFGVQGVIGGALPITKTLSATAALEVPFIIRPSVAVGLSPIIGLSAKL